MLEIGVDLDRSTVISNAREMSAGLCVGTMG